MSELLFLYGIWSVISLLIGASIMGGIVYFLSVYDFKRKLKTCIKSKNIKYVHIITEKMEDFTMTKCGQKIHNNDIVNFDSLDFECPECFGTLHNI